MTRRLRVGYDVRFLANTLTGVGRSAIELLKELSKREEIEELVLVTDRAIPTDWMQEGQPEKMRVVYTRSAPAWQQTVFPLVLLRERVALNHGLAFTIPQYLPLPQIVTVHDMCFMRYPELVAADVRRYLTRRVPQSVRRAQAIVVPSPSMRAELLSFFPAVTGKVHVVPHGTRLLPNSDVPSASDSKSTYVLAVGSADPRKNVITLLRAWRLLGRRDIELKLVGSQPPAQSEVAAEAARLAMEGFTVTWEGYVPDAVLGKLYRGAILFCYPSLYEGFGMPVLEALACGCPVIAGNVPGVRDVARGRALLADVFSPACLATALRKATNGADPSQVAGQNVGLPNSELSWDHTSSLVMTVYQETL